MISALVTLPLAWPLQASAHDLRLLALLGTVQLALPCLLLVRLTRELPAAEIALLALLEVLFGVAWAWLGAGERLSASVVMGGTLVLGALFANQALGGESGVVRGGVKNGEALEFQASPCRYKYRRNEMKVCPIAIVAGCEKCPFFKLCPAKGSARRLPTATSSKGEAGCPQATRKTEDRIENYLTN